MTDNKKILNEEEKENRRFLVLTDDPAKKERIADLVKKIGKKFGKKEVVFLLQNLKLNPTTIVDKFLLQFMPPYKIDYMKESLKKGKKIHLVGYQGSGKTSIKKLFDKYGYLVSEPEDLSDEPFDLPNSIHNIAIIEVTPPVKSENWIVTQSITKADIENWLNA